MGFNDIYVTNLDVETRLGTSAYVQLTDDDGNGEADAEVVDEVRRGAVGEVHSFLARRYAVPIDTAFHVELADLLKTVCLDLIEYRLRARRPPVPEVTVVQRDTTLRWLKDVADGRADLPGIVATASNASRGTIAATFGEERTLSREELDRF